MKKLIFSVSLSLLTCSFASAVECTPAIQSFVGESKYGIYIYMEYKADKGGNGCKMQLFARNPKESVWVTMGGWISIAVAELDSEIQRYEPMELAPDQLPVKTNLKALMPNAPPAAAKPRTVGPIATK